MASLKDHSVDCKEKKQSGIPRRAVALNVFAQVFFLAAGLLLINVFVFNNPVRFDFSQDENRHLAAPTRSLLRALRQQVTIHVLLQRANPLITEIHNTLKEFKIEGGKRIEVRQISPYADFGEAVELQRKFKFGMRENILIVETDDRHLILGMQDLAEFDLSGISLGRPPRVISSHVEMALAGAILDLISGEKKRVFYVTGHGEPSPESEEGLAGLVTVWKRQNIQLELVDLRLANEIEENVAAVILAGPRHDLLPREIDVLRGYLARRGRLLVFLDWGARTENLDFFLAGYGITPLHDRVLMVKGTGPVVQLYRDVMALPNADHPAMRRLRDTTVFMRGATQTLKLSKTSGNGGGVPKPLLFAADGYWGETDHESVDAGNKPQLDPARDNPPPVVVAAAVEMVVTSNDSRANARAPRLVVVGSASCIDPDAVTPGVVDFASSSLNWLLDREGLTGVGPKPPRQFEIMLSQEEISRITGFLLIIMPGLAALAAFATWILRRR